MSELIISPLVAIYEWWMLRRLEMKRDPFLRDLRVKKPLLVDDHMMLPVGPDSGRWAVRLLLPCRSDRKVKRLFKLDRSWFKLEI